MLGQALGQIQPVAEFIPECSMSGRANLNQQLGAFRFQQ